MNHTGTAASASATLRRASLRLRRLIGGWERGKPKPRQGTSE
jgi:hypothetical protein